MKALEKGREKIKNICEALREETLEPAKREAQKIIDEAHKQAESILEEAKQNSLKLQENARAAIAQEQNAFDSSLQQAAKQSIEALHQSIEAEFFNKHLQEIVAKGSADPKMVAKLIDAVVAALAKDGIKADLTALVPKAISPEEVANFLAKDTLNSLGENGLLPGVFAGGAKIKINNKRMTIDISNEALKELLSGYLVRKDFRKLVFGS